MKPHQKHPKRRLLKQKSVKLLNNGLGKFLMIQVAFCVTSLNIIIRKTRGNFQRNIKNFKRYVTWHITILSFVDIILHNQNKKFLIGYG